MIEVFSTKKLENSYLMEAERGGIKITDDDFIKIAPIINAQLRRDLVCQVNRPEQMLVFTSKNAVRTGFENYFNSFSKEYLQTWEFYCISGATRELLLQYIRSEQIIGYAPYAAELGTLIQKKEKLDPIHFFCGNKRRDTLPQLMKEHHILFKEWIVYENIPEPHVIADHYRAYLFYSPSAVESFFSTNTIEADKPCFSIGKTTLAALKETVPNPVFTGREIHTRRLLQLLFNYFNTTYGIIEK